MLWEATSAIVSLLGAISVLVTLLYFARQLKENSKLRTVSVYQTAMGGYNKMASPSLENSELARNLLSDKLAQLSEVDTYKLNLIPRVYLNQVPGHFKVYGAGIFP